MCRSLFLLILLAGLLGAAEGGNVLGISGTQLLLNGQPVKLRGMRLSNALYSDAEVDEVIANLPVFKSYGINAFSSFMMGSRFGDIKGFKPDCTLDPVYAARMKRLIEAADNANMVMLVGGLYWSTSTAKEDLGAWGQAQANLAIGNLCAFVRSTGHRNVFIDPDNEGMSPWDVGQMIAAGHAAAPGMIIGFDAGGTPSSNCDLTIHFGARVPGKPYLDTEAVPGNAPGGYWGSYSKVSGLYNYINIGVYTTDMKNNQWAAAVKALDGSDAGYYIASTWLQCITPHHNPGGQGSSSDPGVRWYLDRLKAKVGPWTGTTTPPPIGPAVTAIKLVDAGTDTVLAALTPGMSIDLTQYPGGIAFIAETDAGTGSVRFDLDAIQNLRTENTAPYAMWGDSAGNYAPWSSPALGAHTIAATPYTADDRTGTAGSTLSFAITLVNGGTAGLELQINFQPSLVAVPAGYVADTGAVFATRGNGLKYGWSRDISGTSRDRNKLSDQLMDTLVQPMNSTLGTNIATWELEVANGTYDVHLVAGDPSYFDSVFGFTLEGQPFLSGTPTSANRFIESTVHVTVSDGRLSLGNGAGTKNNKVCFIEVISVPTGIN